MPEKLLGWSADEAIGMDSRRLFTPEDRKRGEADAEIALASQEWAGGQRALAPAQDGSRFWGSGLLVPLHGEEPGFLKIMRDRTERRQGDERQILLLHELSHRVNNSLAVIMSIARQSGARASDLASFIGDFEGRLRALAAAHQVLSQNGWLGITTDALVQAALAGNADDRIATEVEQLPVNAAAAQSLVLALHELTTNAIKHGALSVPDGRIVLRVAREGGDLAIDWQEEGGPRPRPPRRRGFGTTLLERSITHQHQGRIDFDWGTAGLACRIRIPLAEVVAATERSEGRGPTPARA